MGSLFSALIKLGNMVLLIAQCGLLPGPYLLSSNNLEFTTGRAHHHLTNFPPFQLPTFQPFYPCTISLPYCYSIPLPILPPSCLPSFYLSAYLCHPQLQPASQRACIPGRLSNNKSGLHPCVASWSPSATGVSACPIVRIPPCTPLGAWSNTWGLL